MKKIKGIFCLILIMALFIIPQVTASAATIGYGQFNVNCWAYRTSSSHSVVWTGSGNSFPSAQGYLQDVNGYGSWTNGKTYNGTWSGSINNPRSYVTLFAATYFGSAAIADFY